MVTMNPWRTIGFGVRRVVSPILGRIYLRVRYFSYTTEHQTLRRSQCVLRVRQHIMLVGRTVHDFRLYINPHFLAVLTRRLSELRYLTV